MIHTESPISKLCNKKTKSFRTVEFVDNTIILNFIYSNRNQENGHFLSVIVRSYIFGQLNYINFLT